MEVIAVCPQIDVPHEPRIPALGGELHLEGKGKVILYVRIVEIINIPVRPRTAQAVKIHDLRGWLPVDLRHQMGSLRHSIPVQVDGHLYGRIRLDDRADGRLGVLICIAPVKLAVDDIVHSGVMDRLNAPLVEKLGQILPHSHNTRRRISRCGVCKFFLRMGVEDQYLRSSCRIVDLHAPPQEIIRIELIGTDHRGAVHCIEIAEQIIKIAELLYGHINCRSHFCRRSL